MLYPGELATPSSSVPLKFFIKVFLLMTSTCYQGSYILKHPFVCSHSKDSAKSVSTHFPGNATLFPIHRIGL